MRARNLPTDFYDVAPRNTVLQGDALAMLAMLPDECVQVCVTSPPYWSLRDYGLPPSVWGGGSDCAHVWGEALAGAEGYASGNRKRWQHGATREDEPERWQGETGQGAYCQHCGAPWERVTERAFEPQADVRDPVKLAKRSRKGMDHSNGWGATPRGTIRSDTTGWRRTCRCKENTGAGRSLILDPFMGAGTVGLVAKQAGRDYLGIELNPAYIEMAERRIASNGRMGKRQEEPEGQRTLWEEGRQACSTELT